MLGRHVTQLSKQHLLSSSQSKHVTKPCLRVVSEDFQWSEGQKSIKKGPFPRANLKAQ